MTMTRNPLKDLNRLGQSVWIDSISRGLVMTGGLGNYIKVYGLSGLNSNPTIFEKAIDSSGGYDSALASLAGLGGAAEIFEALAVEDLRMAADELRPVWERTRGEDGYCSLEVSPKLARDAEGTIEEVRRLWKLVGRPNLMVKIPGTAEGLTAIEACLAEGININVTLLFSVKRYGEVVEAYLRAMERRAAEGLPLGMASVASFFVSRVDTAIDKRLEGLIAAEKDPKAKAELKGLRGKAAIANAKRAYRLFQNRFESPRFASLAARGARVQRVLWASTSTKNPAYRDVLYVEELIGRHTVNTLPLETIDAFRRHGRAAETVTRDVPAAEAILAALSRRGIDVEEVARKLEEEGIASFAASYDALLKGIAAKRALLEAEAGGPRRARLGGRERAVASALEELKRQDFGRRLAERDASLWKPDPESRAVIRGALGWLDAPAFLQAEARALTAFADEVRDAGFTSAVVLGMGGSSLAPEVIRRTFDRTFGPQKGWLKLRVLDSTDPGAVAALEKSLDLRRTLFLVASKSGTTVEPNAFLAYFWERVRALKKARAGENFVAITDPGTALEAVARDRGFRRVFLNPADIGGRYSALSCFGMLPAALAGLDVRWFAERAQALLEGCGAAVPVEKSPGAWLGAVLGGCARDGRDKVTFALSPGLASFGLWLEQLLAESTGKEGRGLVPVAGEPLAAPAAYGPDRRFVGIAFSSENGALSGLDALEAAGHPVVRLELHTPYDLGAEFLRWEIATAAAGLLLGINPFDQPNVQEAKTATVSRLAAYARDGGLVEPESPSAEDPGAAEALGRFLGQAKPGDYVALLAYLPETPENDRRLAALQARLSASLRVPVTAGYGPRYLHSTGQLHKGGPNAGLFLVLTAEPAKDLPVPGERHGFAVLERAQALGDADALRAKGRRVLRLRLGKGGLAKLASAVESGVRVPARA